MAGRLLELRSFDDLLGLRYLARLQRFLLSIWEFIRTYQVDGDPVGSLDSLG